MPHEEYKDLLDTFLATCKVQIDGKDYLLVESVLAHDVIAFIQRQLNETARLGYLDDQQEQILRTAAVDDLFTLVYIKHYDSLFEVTVKGPIDEHGNETLVRRHVVLTPLEKDPVYSSAKNLICMLFSRVHRGRDRELEKIKLTPASPIVKQLG
jgi:hypothetical protein